MILTYPPPHMTPPPQTLVLFVKCSQAQGSESLKSTWPRLYSNMGTTTKRIPEVLASPISYVLNTSCREQKLPSVWKKASVIIV